MISLTGTASPVGVRAALAAFVLEAVDQHCAPPA